MENKKYCYEYPRPSVTGDCIVFSETNNETEVLLIERAHEPFKGQWAFPGGFLDMEENAETCAKRELLEETGIENIDVLPLNTYSEVDRDPRGRTISIAFYAKINKNEHKVIAGDDAKKAEWFNINQIPPLAFDHDIIMKDALKAIKL